MLWWGGSSHRHSPPHTHSLLGASWTHCRARHSQEGCSLEASNTEVWVQPPDYHKPENMPTDAPLQQEMLCLRADPIPAPQPAQSFHSKLQKVSSEAKKKN